MCNDYFWCGPPSQALVGASVTFGARHLAPSLIPFPLVLTTHRAYRECKTKWVGLLILFPSEKRASSLIVT